MAAIRARRGGELIALDRMLLHSPPYASGWSALLGAVRGELALPPALRELAICAVAVLNGADYEFALHGPEFLKAGGSPKQLHAIKAIDRAKSDEALFDSAERATLLLAIEMTRRVKVTDTIFAAVRAALGADQPVVELVGVIATYNMVSRFLVALEIEPAG